MSIHNEEDFKIEQNKKKYLITLSIQEDQLFIGLTVLSIPPKKYSSYFSLNELRISSKIFDHTNTLFEAKEIIKRTVIKKQLLIDEDEHRSRITFDTGLGHDSVPFPIILFRDSNDHSNHQNLENPKDNNRNINNKNNDNNSNNSNSNTKKQNNLNSNKNEEENSQNINVNNNQNLRPSIGNNINNKMLNFNNNNNKMNLTIKKRDSNIQFNNSIKRTSNKKAKIRVNENNNNNTNMKKSMSGHTNKKEDSYKKVDLVNNVKNINNNGNNGNASKDYLTINNNLLHNIYNNMNNNNNINSSFYKNLQNSFTNDNIYNNIAMNNNLNNNLINNIPITRLNIRNIDNNSINQTNLQQNNINKINKDKINNNINNNANNNTKKLPYANKKNSNNISIKTSFVSQKYSSRTSDVRRNLTKQNLDNNTDIDTEKKTRNENNNENRNEKNDNDDDKNSLSLSMSENNDVMDENIDEFNIGDQPYRFKNLVIQGSKKIKGNLEKFKKNQNMGDYVPAGAKFVSYLKFPDTKKINSNLSMTASTISSSLTSGSNRIIGIEKNIIKNPAELDEITGRIQRILNKRNIKYKLLYKASVDGDLSSTFHTKCDNISNTLVLIQATKDKRFGGFTTQTWNGEDINKKDKHCFIFSIDNMKVYDINKGVEAINCNPDLGPVFINQIKLLDKFFTQGGSTNKKGKTFDTKEDFEINGGAEKFGVKEVEVYHVK